MSLFYHISARLEFLFQMAFLHGRKASILEMQGNQRDIILATAIFIDAIQHGCKYKHL